MITFHLFSSVRISILAKHFTFYKIKYIFSLLGTSYVTGLSLKAYKALKARGRMLIAGEHNPKLNQLSKNYLNRVILVVVHFT